jgi:hypothetical protein
MTVLQDLSMKKALAEEFHATVLLQGHLEDFQYLVWSHMYQLSHGRLVKEVNNIYCTYEYVESNLARRILRTRRGHCTLET